MELTMMRYGLICGLSFLVVMRMLDYFAYAIRHTPAPGSLPQTDPADHMVWQVLDEARRITEESA